MFPLFYLEIFMGRNKYFIFNNFISFLWFNKTTKVDIKYIYFEELLMNGIKFVGNLFESCGNLKLWVKIKDFHSLESKIFQWMQLIYALGTSWKKSIEKANLITLLTYNHNLIKTINYFLLTSYVAESYIKSKLQKFLFLNATMTPFSLRQA